MTDLNKLRSEFEAQHSDKVFKIVKYDEATNAYCLHDHLPLTEINLSAVAEINYGWDLWQKAKAQAVPETHTHSVTLTCAELKEAYDFGAPDGENDQFQMGTEMLIKWLDDGYDGAGYYCWYADLPEEGCIKLGESESGAEG
ncbi:TPA: hypothetical protein PRO12_003750 [Acinetobacter baumannii]|nr:hypothetical protein [Acinetobacter baumannii]